MPNIILESLLPLGHLWYQMYREYTKDQLTAQVHSHGAVLSPSLDPNWYPALE